MTIPRPDYGESYLTRILAFCLSAGKLRVLAMAVLMMAAITFVDSRIEPSLGVLYILPMIFAAVALAPMEIVALAVVCAILRWLFDFYPSSVVESVFRFLFAATAYTGTGLFIMVLVRNRQQALEHLLQIQHEQGLRRVAQEQLRVLVESSPAGILTLDHKGVVLAANRAATSLFGIEEGGTLEGRAMRDYLPLLSDALQLDLGAGPFHTAAQCQGRTKNGEIFLANTWFSTYGADDGRNLAAIVVDASEEMRDREEENLRQLSASSRIMAAAVSHEIRNLCSAISLLYSNLSAKPGFSFDEHFEALGDLVQGLEGMASLELLTRSHEKLEPVSLRQVLDNLRIVIEPDWREIDGNIRWEIPREAPWVLADSHGLLQALMNVVQNSYRAVQKSAVRELAISVSAQKEKAVVRLQDSGPGIAEPERLFQPFQRGAEATGLGMYVSRAILRSYGGELRFEPGTRGACFTVELQVAGETAHE
jgi:two-component system, LuxR family, sensor kinase FixL